jgi:hypothetical protein
MPCILVCNGECRSCATPVFTEPLLSSMTAEWRIAKPWNGKISKIQHEARKPDTGLALVNMCILEHGTSRRSPDRYAHLPDGNGRRAACRRPHHWSRVSDSTDPKPAGRQGRRYPDLRRTAGYDRQRLRRRFNRWPTRRAHDRCLQPRGCCHGWLLYRLDRLAQNPSMVHHEAAG